MQPVAVVVPHRPAARHPAPVVERHALPREEPGRDDAPAVVQGERVRGAVRRQDLPQLAHEGEGGPPVVERRRVPPLRQPRRRRPAGEGRAASKPRARLRPGLRQGAPVRAPRRTGRGVLRRPRRGRGGAGARRGEGPAVLPGRRVLEAARPVQRAEAVLGPVRPEGAPAVRPGPAHGCAGRGLSRQSRDPRPPAEADPADGRSGPRDAARLLRQHQLHGRPGREGAGGARRPETPRPHRGGVRVRPRLPRRRAHALGQDVVLRVRRPRAARRLDARNDDRGQDDGRARRTRGPVPDAHRAVRAQGPGRA